jgi:hypothetical protein
LLRIFQIQRLPSGNDLRLRNALLTSMMTRTGLAPLILAALILTGCSAATPTAPPTTEAAEISSPA